MRTKPTADFEMSAKRRIALTNDVKLRHAKPFQDRSLQNKESTIENEQTFTNNEKSCRKKRTSE